MKLSEYVENIIEAGNYGQEIDFLNYCLELKSLEALLAVKRLFEDDYGGFTLNYEMKAVAAFCLPYWGQQGLDIFVEVVKQNPSQKNTSISLGILSTLAAGNNQSLDTMIYVRDAKLVETVIESFNGWDSLAKDAQQRLNEIVLSFEDDNFVAGRIGLRLLQIAFTNDDGAIKQLFMALSKRWLTISKPTIDAYENLIENNPEDESVFQNFFENYPQFLDPMALQIWAKPDFHGFREPDFVIRRIDNTYVVVEIENPNKSLMTNANQLTAQATQAVGQVMDYRTFLMERFPEARGFFPEFQDPECLVIIGLESVMNDEQKRALLRENQHRSKLKIVGFDWIAKRAEVITQNIIENNVEVLKERMV